MWGGGGVGGGGGLEITHLHGEKSNKLEENNINHHGIQENKICYLTCFYLIIAMVIN